MKSNTIILIVASLLLFAAAYWFFFTGTGNEPPLSTGEPVSQAQVQFEILIGALEPITFDTRIFSDARFTALVDLTTPVSPESFGRIDPLAPLSGGSAVSQAALTTPVVQTTPATLTTPTTATSSTASTTPETAGAAPPSLP